MPQNNDKKRREGARNALFAVYKERLKMFSRKNKKKQKNDPGWIRNPVYDKLLEHVGHNIVCIRYDREKEDDVFLRCTDCNRTIIAGSDFDKEHILDIFRMSGL